MAHVELTDLVKEFDDVTAVDGISLDIPDESFTVLVGPSGCGKTTTLRLIAGLERATDGEIRIGENVVNDARAYERDIAMVFQNYALYPHKTVRDNMRFGLEQHDTDEEIITERVRETAELLQIEELLERRPSELSGGQQQRVALGRAIVRDPAVFLMDEPLSNLDAKLRVQMRAELNKLHEELSTTTVYVTHDQVEAMTLADQIAVMDNGQIQQVGEPTHVYSNPRNMFVAGFLGSPSMNFLEGTLEESSAGKFELDLGGAIHNVPDEFTDALSSYLGDRVTLGIRPENIALNQDGVPANVHPATVEVVEPQGEKTVLELELETGQSIKAAVDPDTTVEMGDAVNLRFDRDSLQYFDPATGESLTYDAKIEQQATI
ncbi:carbohydrate ABC transporter ATP-binding protein (CUT1 family) [Haloarcula quadrata]|uniref:ABC-type D-xylose/L-arabinose transporter n=3 Tax=Haloarcula TaxID=2237 RepID=Q5UXV5_HALMA|nr:MULTISPECIES: ABC transporter ATP-binding protein [Haloarcula]AAV47898.1 Sn-glycerol-3-phosphate transport system ATP-binding [Haloarcula marismortui ATCC 43049]EMA12094.1 sn-glycerol-3-phosphate transport system ATP-binding protein [Haloarcula sinaiiensis ATCC 33800]NHN63908.1 ABC transporter ATP-binding protein [Haloarcula sp. JP-Z28]NHX39382.1 ABC transporter ATP-binding protein [Haloarcula sp. R1-2]QCP92573.1 ABC transporter ATP-binding protein [Haloarcula marismortui ATCC 43049]